MEIEGYESLDMKAQKPCPKCGKQMIKWLTGGLGHNPPDKRWNWRCGCGYLEEGGSWRIKTDEEMFQEEWEKAQEMKPV